MCAVVHPIWTPLLFTPLVAPMLSFYFTLNFCLFPSHLIVYFLLIRFICTIYFIPSLGISCWTNSLFSHTYLLDMILFSPFTSTKMSYLNTTIHYINIKQCSYFTFIFTLLIYFTSITALFIFSTPHAVGLLFIMSGSGPNPSGKNLCGRRTNGTMTSSNQRNWIWIPLKNNFYKMIIKLVLLTRSLNSVFIWNSTSR